MWWLIGGMGYVMLFAITGLFGTMHAAEGIPLQIQTWTLIQVVFAIAGFGTFTCGIMFFKHTRKVDHARLRNEAIRVKVVEAIYKFKCCPLENFNCEATLLAWHLLYLGNPEEQRIGMWYVLLHQRADVAEMLTRHKNVGIRELAKKELRLLRG